ncbi:MAG: hypothetical protein H6581_01500 [Bacteroidia bacterium]|nr:hypothetical protein [Bacteroidia bacterium]
MEHTTNYFNAFIEISEDSPRQAGEIPPLKGDKKSIANLQFEMVYDHPFKYTSDDVIFGVHAIRKEFSGGELEEERQIFFSKGQPCFRASPLTKQYGWGVYSNAEGKIALFAADSEEYRQYVANDSIPKVKAMRNKRP